MRWHVFAVCAGLVFSPRPLQSKADNAWQIRPAALNFRPSAAGALPASGTVGTSAPLAAGEQRGWLLPCAAISLAVASRRKRGACLSTGFLPPRTLRARVYLEDSSADEPTPSIADNATAAIDKVLSSLGPDTDPPASLLSLKSAISDGDEPTISRELFCLLIEQTLDYDMTEEGTVIKSIIDYSNKDDPEVRGRMEYVYGYGIQMFQKGFISADVLKPIVEERIASRVGLDGPGLDQWLNVPPAV